jgi:hypothetical protein
MGLDMYAHTTAANLIGDQQVDIVFQKDDKGEDVGVDTDFAYWRKFNHLHGWMERLYREKGGKNSDFNCDTVRLMPEDIDRLESDVSANKLTATAGFFFGGDALREDDIESLEDFIQRSRQAFTEGLAVVYTSWW